MATKLQVLESLLGEEVSIITFDRQESEYNGELLEWSELGPVLKYQSHGREFITFIPMRNIDSLTHKVLSVNS